MSCICHLNFIFDCALHICSNFGVDKGRACYVVCTRGKLFSWEQDRRSVPRTPGLRVPTPGGKAGVSGARWPRSVTPAPPRLWLTDPGSGREGCYRSTGSASHRLVSCLNDRHRTLYIPRHDCVIKEYKPPWYLISNEFWWRKGCIIYNTLTSTLSAHMHHIIYFEI